MSRARSVFYARYAAWSILLFNLLLILFANRSLPSLLWIIVVVGWFVLSNLFAATVLPLLYQPYLQRWWYWLLLLSMCLLGLFFIESKATQHTFIDALSVTIFMYTSWAMIVSLSVQLVKHDIGLRWIAVVTLVWIWASVAMLNQQPDLVEMVMRFIALGEPKNLWWIGMVLVACSVIIPIGTGSFLWHTALILWREMYDASPPPRPTRTSER